MSKFEGLIRQALQTQDASDASKRERIYASSRRALERMLSSSSVDEEVAGRQRRQLEIDIARIEAEHAPPPPPQIPEPAPAPIPEAVVEPAPQPAQLPDTGIVDSAAADATLLQPAPGATVASDVIADLPSETAVKGTASRLPSLDRTKLGSLASGNSVQPVTGRNAPQTPQQAAGSTLERELAGIITPHKQAIPQKDQEVPAADTEVRAPTMDQRGPAIASPTQDAEAQTDEDQLIGILDGVVEPDPPVRDAAPDPADGLPVKDDVAPPPDGPVHAQPEVSAADADLANDAPVIDESDAYPRYRRKNPIMRRIWPILFVLGLILVILWVVYAFFTQFNDQPDQPVREQTGPVGQTQINDDGGATITLLEPTDLSALVTAGRGTAELTTVQNEQMLRLQSIRADGNFSDYAEPLLLQIEPGVLRQIAGRQVTVEFLAKSAMPGPAQLSIECMFGGESMCGRKRFRLGQQPEKIIFLLDLRNVTEGVSDPVLAINTDVTAAAETSGEGDVVDVIFARLRFEP